LIRLWPSNRAGLANLGKIWRVRNFGLENR
jgi:hypothetical protein